LSDKKEIKMDILLVTSGIKAALRAAQAGIDLYVERAEDKAIFLPNVRLPPATISDEITSLLNDKQELRTLLPFSHGWDNVDFVWNSPSELNKQDCIVRFIEFKSAEVLLDVADDHKQQLIGGRMIEQWRQDNQPPTAWARIALTITDIGLEFVSANPSIMGENSQGEALISAFANNLTTLIPDDVTDMGNRHDFESRLIGIFLRAGLSTLLEDQGTIIEDDNVEALIKGIIKPVNDNLPNSFQEQIEYRKLTEALMGPSAAAALKILSSNTKGFLGNKFANDTALGAVTKAILDASANTATDDSIATVFTKNGVTTLFDSALAIAIEKPQLFIDDEGNPKSELLTDLFVNTAIAVKEANNNGFDKNLGVSLSAMVISTLGDHAEFLVKLDPDKPWESVAVQVIQSLTTNLSEAIIENRRLQLFSQEQQFEYARIVLQHVSATPSMLGTDNPEYQRILKGIAEVMAHDDNLLLSNNEWILIAATAAELAAVNPERLFGLDNDNGIPDKLAITALKSLLTITNTALTSAPQLPLRGYTLSSTMELLLKALSGNISGVANNPALIETYFSQLIEKVENDQASWGSESIVTHVRETIFEVVANGELPTD
jgi:hypothetical protein